MVELLKALSGGEIAGYGGLIVIICGFILKKTGLLKKLREWADLGSKWLDKAGHNIGVFITTKANSVPVFGLFWENLIEPPLVIICELIPGMVFEFFNSLTNGLKSDNKAFKTKKNPEGK